MTPPEADVTLQMKRTYDASRQAVFDAWTRDDGLKSWFCPDPQGEVVIHTLEPRSGGRFRVEMRMPHASFIVAGTYREVRPPERLVFTWAWEHETDVPETLVTVALSENDGRTEMVLTHERFANEQERNQHEHGWVGCFTRLGPALEGERSPS